MNREIEAMIVLAKYQIMAADFERPFLAIMHVLGWIDAQLDDETGELPEELNELWEGLHVSLVHGNVDDQIDEEVAEFREFLNGTPEAPDPEAPKDAMGGFNLEDWMSKLKNEEEETDE